MHFTAQIKRGSAIDRMWRAHRRLGGHVSGVLFSTPNFVTGAYVCKDSLHAHSIASIKDNPSVELIATGIPLPLEPPQDGSYLGPEVIAAQLPNKLQAAPMAKEEPVEDDGPEEATDPASGDEGPAAKESCVESSPDATKEPVAQENVVKSETTQQNVVDETKIETFKPKNNTGRRRR